MGKKKDVIGDLIAMGKTNYQLGTVWKDLKEAKAHAKELRRSEFGIMKRKVHAGVKVEKRKEGFAVLYKESKGYLRWLRTGRG